MMINMLPNLMRAYADLVNVEDESLNELGPVVIASLPQTVSVITVGDYLRLANLVASAARKAGGDALAADALKVFANAADAAA